MRRSNFGMRREEMKGGAHGLVGGVRVQSIAPGEAGANPAFPVPRAPRAPERSRGTHGGARAGPGCGIGPPGARTTACAHSGPGSWRSADFGGRAVGGWVFSFRCYLHHSRRIHGYISQLIRIVVHCAHRRQVEWYSVWWVRPRQ
ncbi:hypothetical protein BV25DRAFT_489092 [Artomyces pyxidatus]|uniref:Uncharacterized protein n=1 Tax=Artomyces pyxidatus TaxID=48021 RepID=A0ACB8T4E4_9AGAM|nr:hypothetical protein BV25DRAFT_489092 [Artomyces pyxidatus]